MIGQAQTLLIQPVNVVNPWRACAPRITVLGLCVYDYSRTTMDELIGYVSKSSAALNSLTITQLACKKVASMS